MSKLAYRMSCYPTPVIRRCTLLLLTSLITALLAISIAVASREEWGAPQVSSTHHGNTWTIRGQKQVVTLNETDLSFEVKAGDAAWRMNPSTVGDLQVRSGKDTFALRLADAKRISIVPYDTGFKTGVKVALVGWRRPDSDGRETSLDLSVILTIALEGNDEDLVFDTVATDESTVVTQLDWPPALHAGDVDYSVLCNQRGVLLPRNWPKAYHPIRTSNLDGSNPDGDTSEVQSNIIECWSMPWWGFKKKGLRR